LFLTTTQLCLREHDAARRSESCSFEGDWFLNVTRMRVAQRRAASETLLMRDTQQRRHKLSFCCLLCFVFFELVLCCVCTTSCEEELDEKLIDWKMSLETLKNSVNLISLSIKYFPIKLAYYPSSFLLLKMSVALSHTYCKPVNNLPLLQVLWQLLLLHSLTTTQ
jgi:hypothetical protein